MSKFSAEFIGYLGANSIARIVSEELNVLLRDISHNIQYKSTNSGKIVNYLGAPADTTGETIRSMQVVTESREYGRAVSLIGRKGIWNIDKGNPPAKSSGEYNSFRSFFQVIKEWARAKEWRYGLRDGEINAYAVARSVWRKGGVLYQEGGGTESITDIIPRAWERIERDVDAATKDISDFIIEEFSKTVEINAD